MSLTWRRGPRFTLVDICSAESRRHRGGRHQARRGGRGGSCRTSGWTAGRHPEFTQCYAASPSGRLVAQQTHRSRKNKSICRRWRQSWLVISLKEHMCEFGQVPVRNSQARTSTVTTGPGKNIHKERV